MIKLIKSTFFQEEKIKEALIEFIKSAEQLSFGPECEKFERDFAKWQGREYAVFFNSGSSANLALIQALLNLGKIRKGDKAGFSAVTWSTNVMPLMQFGLEAVPVDVELETLNVSSQKLAEVLSRHKIKLFFLTNLLGFCDDIDNILTICQENGILLLEDNCESLGTVYNGIKLGNFGLASTFSFYVGHHLSTIEGGMAVTDDAELAAMLKIVRAHGWDRNMAREEQASWRKRHNVKSDFYARYTFYDFGYNLRPTEINGFLGNAQLPYLEEIIRKREINFKQLATAIYADTRRYYPIKYDHLDTVSNFAFPMLCRSKEIQEELIGRCSGRIEIRPIVAGNIVQQPFFQKYSPDFVRNVRGSNSAIVHNQGLYFGNNPELTEEEIKEIIHVFTS